MKKEIATLTNSYLFIFFCFIILTSEAQQKKFTINWNGSTKITNESFSIEVPSFDKGHFNFEQKKGLRFFSQWKTNQIVDENSISVTNISYQTISRADLKDLDLATIPNQVDFFLKNSKARSENYAFFEISPIVKQQGQYKKITAFTVNYNFNKNAQVNTRDNFEIESSVLKSGSWKKFQVDKTGVFIITKQFLNSLGMNTNVDPRTIKIYGNGGNMLPYANDVSVPFDPEENAIKFIGEEDGVFNDEDYILFYAEGPYGFNEENGTHINMYTENIYYYITSSGSFGKRIGNMQQPIAAATTTINSFNDYQFHENDEESLGEIGRRWFGNSFQEENDQTFEFNFPNIDTSVPAKVRVVVGGVSLIDGPLMSVKVNDVPFHNFINVGVLGQSQVASGSDYTNIISVNSENISVNLNYNSGGNPVSSAFLDFIAVEAVRDLAFTQEQMLFTSEEASNVDGVVEYQLTNASAVNEVWDITDKYNIKRVDNETGLSELVFKANGGEQRNYIAISNTGFYSPIKPVNPVVLNQDLKGTIFQNAQGQFQDVDYLIITRADMLAQANRLAEINKQQYGLNVKVVDQELIYNEFNNGNTDISAIRNFVKYVYFNASSDDKRVKYLCLFGDGSYDYKDRIRNNTNVVPSWHAYESFNLATSFVSDDFYALMDDNEGTVAATDKLDIAVGRILADTPARAKYLVDKIQGYYVKEARGAWRNNFMVISDDVDEAWEYQLQETTDQISDYVENENPSINRIKVHSDAFQQEASSGGERYPTVNNFVKDKIDVGALVVTYFGHGGEDGLARERIFDKNNSQDLRNVCRLNCFITVTCEYTKFDNPNRETGGELTYWNKEAGAVALITTTRQIFMNVGVSMNILLTKYLFGLEGNEITSAAEALRLTKLDPLISGINQRRLVFFIGDPAMKLAFPKPEIRLTKVNDIPVNEFNESLEALSPTKVSGELVDLSGNVLTNYDGVLTATIFDKEIDRQTLANDGISENGSLLILDFKTPGETIFRGQATIENGRFEFDFIVPRDIAIPVGKGKISFYAQSENNNQDYSGANLSVDIGGLNENAEEDNIAPIISLYMNDESFVSGGVTNEQPVFIAKLEDEHGINTSSGIGHDLVAILDGKETNPFILNDYYKADVDTYKKGEVNFQFRDLSPGLHTISFKAWDVYNNSATSEIQFLVKDKDEELFVNNVLNYPNPFVDYTEFWFNHNSAEPLDVSVQIFTVSGKLVRTLNGQTTNGSKNASSISRDIVWDGRDDFGDKIGKGVYIYKLKVRSNTLNKQFEKIEKLVIL